MSTETTKTVKELLGQRIYGIEAALNRIDRIASGVEAIGSLFVQVNDADYMEQGGCRLEKSQRLMAGLYGCVQMMGYYVGIEGYELKSLLEIEENE